LQWETKEAPRRLLATFAGYAIVRWLDGLPLWGFARTRDGPPSWPFPEPSAGRKFSTAGGSRSPSARFQAPCSPTTRRKDCHSRKPPLEKAGKLLERCEAGSAKLAHEALGRLISDLATKGFSIEGFGLLLASGRPLPALASVLASHALIHAADGEHFRDALAQAALRRGLPLTRIPERELYAAAAKRFRTTAGAIQARVQAAGKPLGPPWTADQKLAALIAWLALAKQNGTTAGPPI
jgi:hypothetical protein